MVIQLLPGQPEVVVVYLLQGNLSATQDERQSVMARRPLQLFEPTALQPLVKAGYPIIPQQVHEGNIQGTGQGGIGGHGTVVGVVKVGRHEGGKTAGYIRKEGSG